MDIIDQAETLQTQSDFVAFLISLAKNLERQPENWENDTLSAFLEGMVGYAEHVGQEPTWRDFARLLLAARVYE